MKCGTGKKLLLAAFALILVPAASYAVEFNLRADTVTVNLPDGSPGGLDVDMWGFALEENFGTAAEFTVPPGGIYLWLKLPPEVDTLKLSEPALEEGVAINAGPHWSVDGEAARNHMRLCFANPSKAEIREGVAKLAEVCHRETGIPELSANIRRGTTAD